MHLSTVLKAGIKIGGFFHLIFFISWKLISRHSYPLEMKNIFHLFLQSKTFITDQLCSLFLLTKLLKETSFLGIDYFQQYFAEIFCSYIVSENFVHLNNKNNPCQRPLRHTILRIKII